MTSPVMAHRAHVRSPVDVVRLIGGVLIAAVGFMMAVTFDRAFLGLRDDGAAAIDSLPEWAADVPAAILAAGLVTVALRTAARFDHAPPSGDTSTSNAFRHLSRDFGGPLGPDH